MKKKKWVLGIIGIVTILCLVAVLNQSSNTPIHKQALEVDKPSGTDQDQDQEQARDTDEDMTQMIKQIVNSPSYKYRSHTFVESSTVLVQLDIQRSNQISKREDINKLRSDAICLFSSMQDVKKITFDIGAFVSLKFTREWAEGLSDVNLTADTLTADILESDALTGTENGPFIGFISDEKSDRFDVYSEKNATYVTRLPMSLLSSFYEDKKLGWIEEAEVYYGASGDFIWGVIATSPNLGTGKANVCTSVDQGENWWIGAPDSMLSGTVTGAGFASKEIGFLSYRYLEDEGPEIARTLDGGKTWEHMKVVAPDPLERQGFTPLNPTFDDKIGIYPIMQSLDSKMLYLITEDGGLTWQWQDRDFEEE